MLGIAMQALLGGSLVVAALLKAARPGPATAALSTFAVPPAARGVVLWATIAAELGLGAAVIAGSDAAAYAAAALLAVFALVAVSALLQGRAGAPCACFGGGSTLGPWTVARNLALAAGFAALPSLPDGPLSTDQWLGLGLIALALVSVALGVGLFALIREVGMLRLRAGPSSALEIAGEGPEIGGRSELVDRFDPGPRAQIALAVFTSAGCHVCRSLEPAIESLRAEPALSVATFDESSEPALWEALQVPGAPYALALDLSGTVFAKGTFNNLAQLESVVATAERRIGERARVEALGV